MFTPIARGKPLLLCAASAVCVMLCACGGGGGGGHIASTPPPPSPPPPPPPPPPPLDPEDVRIFSSPTPQTFASVGVAAVETGSGATMGFTGLSKARSDQVHIRYSSGGYYEIEMPGANWDKLGFAKGIIPQDPSLAIDFQPQSAPQSGAHLIVRNSRLDGYKYSELAGWFDGLGGFGEIAFGSATAAGGVPVTGSATYSGVVSGTSDVVGWDSFDGFYRLPVDGTVELGFDFGKGSLDGAMTLYLPDGMQPLKIGTFAFEDTVFSAGSTTYSGKFDTAATGQNYFLGQFTGPNAEETIGAWALPFVLSTGGETVAADGKTHQAFGAWIAQRP